MARQLLMHTRFPQEQGGEHEEGEAAGMHAPRTMQWGSGATAVDMAKSCGMRWELWKQLAYKHKEHRAIALSSYTFHG